MAVSVRRDSFVVLAVGLGLGLAVVGRAGPPGQPADGEQTDPGQFEQDSGAPAADWQERLWAEEDAEAPEAVTVVVTAERSSRALSRLMVTPAIGLPVGRSTTLPTILPG